MRWPRWLTPNPKPEVPVFCVVRSCLNDATEIIPMELSGTTDIGESSFRATYTVEVRLCVDHYVGILSGGRYEFE